MLDYRKDIWSGLVIGVLAVALHVHARGITSRFSTGVDSGFFPEVVSAFLAVSAFGIAARAYFAGGPGQRDTIALLPVRVVVSVLLMAAAILVMPILGFTLTAIVYLFVQMIVLTFGAYQIWPKILLSVVLGISISLLFSRVFGLILPGGILF